MKLFKVDQNLQMKDAIDVFSRVDVVNSPQGVRKRTGAHVPGFTIIEQGIYDTCGKIRGDSIRSACKKHPASVFQCEITKSVFEVIFQIQ
jgi:hypothetical protein